MRDQFLTEAMGLCWHKAELTIGDDIDSVGWKCVYCGKDPHTNIDFSTWEGFGKLYEWASKQTWWVHFIWSTDPFRKELECISGPSAYIYNINPDTFANKLYKYLKKN